MHILHTIGHLPSVWGREEAAVNAETEMFLRDMYGRCAGLEQPAYLTLTAIHPDGDRPTPSRHVPLGNPWALDRALGRLTEANAQSWGAYFGVALRKAGLGRWARGGKGDLVTLPALFADLDDPDSAPLRLGWFDLPASCVVHSGHGYHVYWFLEPPTTDFAAADRAIRGLAHHLGGDPAVSIAHSMRLPGTLNTKPGRGNVRCAIERYFPDRLYSLTEFRRFMYMPVVHYLPLASRGRWSEPTSAPDAAALQELTEAVLVQLEGRPRGNGFIAARCPLPHQVDRPGGHFSYDPHSGWGRCFGKHGRFSPSELCRLLGVRAVSVQSIA